MLSQFGYQESYDSLQQRQRGIDDWSVNPKKVQGWNGSAVHRVLYDDEEASPEFVIEVQSLQMETDTGNMDDLDLVSWASQDRDFMGKWVLSNFTETVTASEAYFDVTVNRYMPRWASDKDEDWDDDYRWSPSSPQMYARLYQRTMTYDKTAAKYLP